MQDTPTDVPSRGAISVADQHAEWLLGATKGDAQPFIFNFDAVNPKAV